ncbi:MAG: NEW3 domain-containing protein, partial [Actinomycetota bacterium]|nr:NEW3 domain-containing protein [Actinomycetota bacterium]
DLLEQAREHPDPQQLHGYEIATVTARLDVERLGAAGPLAPDAETAQPLYARYWLHNRGPAPLGGMPVTPALHPHRLDADPGARLSLDLTVASDSVDAELAGAVTLACPAGWDAAPAAHPVQLGAGEHVCRPLAVTVPADAAPGLYPIRARLDLTGDVPPSWRQPVEDVAVVRVGDPGADRLLYVDGPGAVEVSAGQSARLRVTVGTDAYHGLAVEAQLISPWGTWEWAGPAAVGAELPARGSIELDFTLSPPVWAPPGTWWALVRVGGAGALVYSPAVRLAVAAPGTGGLD